MKQAAFLSIALLTILSLSCERAAQITDAPPAAELTQVEKQIISADNSFGFKLFTRINEGWQKKNVFISPLSVSMALAMTLNGANGATYDSIRKTLELAELTPEEINASYKNIRTVLPQIDPKVLFEIANSIWYRMGFTVEQTFLDVNRTAFDAEITQADFSNPATLDAINGWVNVKTHGKITEIINSISNDAMMFLINAIYFKGTWTYEFDKSKTEAMPFTTAEGKTVSCQMMRQKAFLAYAQIAETQVVDLPYGGGNYSMTIVLPPQGIDIDAYTAALTQDAWSGLIAALQKDTVQLYLPKFKVEWEDTVNRPLIELGMGIAFSWVTADFTRINRDGGIYISFVKHKTFVQVDEEGTEAAAVTIVGFERTSIGGGPPVVMLNRPFLFMIREHSTGTVVFVGKIVDPS